MNDQAMSSHKKKPKSYKQAFKRRMLKISEDRERLALDGSATVLSTLNQFYDGLISSRVILSRHSSGTRASGLRRELRGKLTVKDFRNRFGTTEEQSSRLRGLRKAARHSARRRFKKELDEIICSPFRRGFLGQEEAR